MYHPDTLMSYRGTDLLTLLICYLLGKMKPTSHSKMFISSNFVDMSNVIHHTIYSSVENGRLKLKEAEQFVIKLYYLFIINCYKSQFTSMVKSKKHSQRTTSPKQFIRVCAVPIWLFLVYHLQKNMIISPIELCNPSVADPEGAAPSLRYHPQETTNFGFCLLQKAPFKALDFDIFLVEHDPEPL